ncbi:uncharacterized protein LOC143851536 [Tasmannia lanceolata]|uniref:uncharacterized protein LOC143851536 n=1 Tax=Tasmannia lanceolata TaxID=3420 RepID=UPI00406334C4
MNTDQKDPQPDLAMVCIPAKQESHGNHIRSEFPMVSTPIEARPLQSLPPPSSKTVENCGEGEEEKKHEKEHKRRSKNWTRIETLKLIRIRSEMEPRFSRSGRKSELWDEISEALRKEGMSRDAQQCRDKWEKLTAGYKEVREGVREKEDYPFYEDLDALLSGKAQRKEAQRIELQKENEAYERSDGEETEDASNFPARKRRRFVNCSGGGSCSEEMMETLKELLESLMTRQHRFFVDLLESIERREKIREKNRQEREEKWREEDRAQRVLFQNAMILLTKKLVNDGGNTSEVAGGGSAPAPEKEVPVVGIGGGLKKRSKNWKRTEVLLLIKLRTEMEERFAKSTRRAGLWDEVAELLCAEGVKRDGKQCREKWDKLMAEFKDVSDGKRDSGDSPYFADLLARGSSSLDNPTAVIE